MKNNRAFRNYTIVAFALAIFACCTPIIYSTLVELTKELETDFEPALQATCIMLGLLSGIVAYAIVRALGGDKTEETETETEERTKRYVIRHKPNNLATHCRHNRYYNDQGKWIAKITAAKHYHTPEQAQETVDKDGLQGDKDVTIQPIYIEVE